MSKCVPPDARQVCVLWDFDGTLVDSAGATLKALSRALSICGHDAEGLTAEAAIGPPLVETLRTRGLAEADITRVRERYCVEFLDNGLRDVRPFAGITDLLGHLGRAGVRQGIVSNRLQGVLDALARTTGLIDLVEVCVGRAGVRDSKVAVIKFAMDLLGIRSNTDVVLVGDRAEDVDAAARVGVKTIAVRWGYARKGELRTADDNVVVSTLQDLWVLLEPTRRS